MQAYLNSWKNPTELSFSDTLFTAGAEAMTKLTMASCLSFNTFCGFEVELDVKAISQQANVM